MKIMITGSNGQLGNELKSIIDSGKSEIGAAPKEIYPAEVFGVDIDTLDITDEKAVLEFVLDKKPDVIINCAAMTNVDGCETNLEGALKVNADSVMYLGKAAEQIGAKLIHVSTDYVFAGDAEKPYVESDKCAPKTAYGKSKFLGEQNAAEYCSKYFVVRTSWLYGYIGKNFVKTMRRVGKANGKLTVVSDQRGNPTNANDLAHHLLKLAVTDNYGIYHCTGNGECSWYDFAKKIIELSKIDATVSPCTSEEYPSPTPRPKYSSLENAALKATVGDEMRDWEVALEEYIEKLNKMEEE